MPVPYKSGKVRHPVEDPAHPFWLLQLPWLILPFYVDLPEFDKAIMACRGQDSSIWGKGSLTQALDRNNAGERGRDLTHQYGGVFIRKCHHCLFPGSGKSNPVSMRHSEQQLASISQDCWRPLLSAKEGKDLLNSTPQGCRQVVQTKKYHTRLDTSEALSSLGHSKQCQSPGWNGIR